MANKRMFSREIVTSDAFLMMSTAAQAVYIQLCMNADDDGFVNSPVIVCRMTGATQRELEELKRSKFIYQFTSGVVVIKHWCIHNNIRGDRKKDTNYKDEMEMLEVKDNGAYTFREELDSEETDADDARKMAYKKSSLPYSFSYKIRLAFNGHTCPACKNKMTTSVRMRTPSIQHNIPISKGGAHELDNISVVCSSCNSSIGTKETGGLNNAEVIEMWDKIQEAERRGVRWMEDPKKLDEIFRGQNAAECQSIRGELSDNPPQNDSIDKYSIDKIRLDKYSIPPKGGVGEKEKPTKMQNKFKEMLADAELSDSLKDKLTEWLEYKTEIKKPYKSETGFKQFLGTVSNYSRKFPDAEIIDAISQSMANGYQGIVWDYLGRKKTKAEPKKPENANNLQALADYWQNEI